MVIGAAGELPKPPEKPIIFLEGAPSAPEIRIKKLKVSLTDMDDSELAEAVRSLSLNERFTDIITDH